MDATRAVVVALLLCVASVGGVVAGDGHAGPPQQTTPEPGGTMTVFSAANTSEYLAPRTGNADRADGRTADLDVAAAVEGDAESLESAYRRSALERRYGNADTDAERRAAIESGVERVENRIDELTAREEAAIRRYNAGEIDTRELLWTLAVVSRDAEETAATLAWLENAADEVGAGDEAERIAVERVRLVPLRGPVRTALGEAVAGNTPIRVSVETAGTGIVLAAVDPADGTYLREATDPSAKTDEIGDQYEGNPSPALERFEELYPWAIDHFEAVDALGSERVRLYRFSAGHGHGDLETYLDSGSEEILHERQWIDAAEMPSRTIDRTDGDLRVVLNRTRGGGPLGVSVSDATTGTPVDAEIALNGDRIGTTDGDRLWTVAPQGTATINATYAGETATVETTFQ
jgi:hypothetical protein